MINTVPQIKKADISGGYAAFPAKLDCTAFDADMSFVYSYLNQHRPSAKVSDKVTAAAEIDSSLEKEEYRISIKENEIKIFASTYKGLNRAMAALLSMTDKDGNIPCAEISDKPDFEYRSFMVDVGRQTHYISYVKKYIDMCWLYRMSYFQLHLSDNPGIAVPIDSFPNLATEGRAYTKEEIIEIRRYAKERGIEIVPELDVPGHSEQFMKKYPEIFGNNGILPASEEVFESLEKVFSDLCNLFPESRYVHIGGDEAAIGNWEKCEVTQGYMKAHNIASIEEMYAIYVKKMTDYLLSIGKTPIVWEGFPKEYNDIIDRRVIVVSWENYYQTAFDLVDAGFTIINCSWQPLYIVTPRLKWSPEHILNGWNMYNWQHWWDKSAAYGNVGLTVDSSKINLMGAQMCAWGDIITEYDDCVKACDEELELISERIGALAEKTWNKDSKLTVEQYNECRYVIK